MPTCEAEGVTSVQLQLVSLSDDVKTHLQPIAISKRLQQSAFGVARTCLVGVALNFVLMPILCRLCVPKSRRDRENASVFALPSFVLQMASSKLLGLLAKEKAAFFYKTMTSWMIKGAAKLEFPTQFSVDHGEEFEEDIVFERSGTEWRLKLVVYHIEHRSSRVYTSSDGWKAFIMDNNVNIGDVLVFELVQFSRFYVHIFHDRDSSFIAVKWAKDRSISPASLDPTRNGGRNRSHDRPLYSPTKVAFGSRFIKILSPSHAHRLDIPSHFWRCYGADKFDYKLFCCEGPRKKCLVRAVVIQVPRQTKCSLSGKGWHSFYVGNGLKTGDIVSFSLIGSACFEVSVSVA